MSSQEFQKQQPRAQNNPERHGNDEKKKKRDPILDLSKYADKEICVKFTGGREMIGVLKGYDQLMNLVLDNGIERLRDPEDPSQITDKTRKVGLFVCRVGNIRKVLLFWPINPPPPSPPQKGQPDKDGKESSLSFEAKVDECVDKFKTALRSMQKGWRHESLKMLRDLASQPVILGTEGTSAEEAERDRKATREGGVTVERLRYLIHRTIGQSILYIIQDSPRNQNSSSNMSVLSSAHIKKDLSSNENVLLEEALKHLILATEKDPSDVQGWYALGHCALSSGYLTTARQAFISGLKASGDPTRVTKSESSGGQAFSDADIEDGFYKAIVPQRINSPAGWWCLQFLCKTLYLQDDLVAMSKVIKAAKRLDPQFSLPNIPTLEDGFNLLYLTNSVNVAMSIQMLKPQKFKPSTFNKDKPHVLKLNHDSLNIQDVGRFLLDVASLEQNDKPNSLSLLVKLKAKSQDLKGMSKTSKQTQESYKAAPTPGTEREASIGSYAEASNDGTPVLEEANVGNDGGLSDKQKDESTEKAGVKRKCNRDQEFSRSKRRSMRCRPSETGPSRSYSSSSLRSGSSLIPSLVSDPTHSLFIPQGSEYDREFISLLEIWLVEIGWLAQQDIQNNSLRSLMQWSSHRKDVDEWFTSPGFLSLVSSKSHQKGQKSSFSSNHRGGAKQAKTPGEKELTAYTDKLLAYLNDRESGLVPLLHKQEFIQDSLQNFIRDVNNTTLSVFDSLVILITNVLSSGFNDIIIPGFSKQDIPILVDILASTHTTLIQRASISSGILCQSSDPIEATTPLLDNECPIPDSLLLEIWRATTAVEILTAAIIYANSSQTLEAKLQDIEYMLRDWRQALDLSITALCSLHEDANAYMEIFLAINELRMEWSTCQLNALKTNIAEYKENLLRVRYLYFELSTKVSNGESLLDKSPQCLLTGRSVTSELLEGRISHVQSHLNLIDASTAIKYENFIKASKIIENQLYPDLSSKLQPEPSPALSVQTTRERRILLSMLNMAYRGQNEFEKSTIVTILSLKILVDELTQQFQSPGNKHSYAHISALLEEISELLADFTSSSKKALENRSESSQSSPSGTVSIGYNIFFLPWSPSSENRSKGIGLTLDPLIQLINISLASMFRFRKQTANFVSPSSNHFGNLLATISARLWTALSIIWDNHPHTQSFYAQKLDSSDEQSEPGEPDDNLSSSESDNLNFVVLTEEIHRVMGERGLCCHEDGLFVHHCLEIYRRLHIASGRGDVLWDDISQCLFCLYQLKLDPEGSPPEEHCVPSRQISRKEGLQVYDLVEQALIARIQQTRGAPVRAEVRSGFEKLVSSIGDPPLKSKMSLAHNTSIVKDYLSRSMPFTSADLRTCIELTTKKNRNGGLTSSMQLPLLSVPDKDIEGAHRALHYIHGAMMHDMVRSRARNQAAQLSQELIDDVLKQYHTNVIINPKSWHAWYLLGVGYMDKAESSLLASAKEIKDMLPEIGDMQYRALLCFAQSFRRAPCLLDRFSKDKKNTDPDSYWSLVIRRVHSYTATLLYSMASRPLSLQGFSSAHKPEQTSFIIAKQLDAGYWGSQRDQVSEGLEKRFIASKSPWTAQEAFKLSAYLFNKASILDPKNWKFVYMLAKALGKCGEVEESCACYLKSALLSTKPQSSTSQSESDVPSQPILQITDASIDPVYKLLSSLTKQLFRDKMSESIVSKYLDVLCNQTDLKEIQDQSELADPATSVPMAPNYATFKRIRGIAAYLCQVDRKKWHHRPKYLVAWIDYNILSSPETAKKEMFGLLHMRSTTKQLASFYKTDFERTGKHYVYLEKYIRLLSLILRNLGCIDDLQVLRKKVMKGENTLFHYQALASELSQMCEELDSSMTIENKEVQKNQDVAEKLEDKIPQQESDQKKDDYTTE
ncbi:Histone transcription regulator 3 [Mycoemilia scoparia]|uniref:Histone transcription regulator 3 n=1 Tax=Mycoemilia scoparia TaxID=417184 RepID=A0A9W8DQL0_9FUNG|nr:Histone transcription regulator 3 [Mycoemilia scoparia]